MGHRLLVVEDEKEILQLVQEHLTREGFDVVCARDGEEGLRKFHEGTFSMVLLDIMLPEINGIELLKTIRQSSAVPVLIVSAKGSELDKALGLGFGADDYIAKPFSFIELTARVNAAIRRATEYTNRMDGQAKRHLEYRGLRLDVDAFMAVKEGRSIKLTAKEFALLQLLMEHPKQVFTKAQLYQHAWNDTYYGDENVINVHIRRLREKVETDPSNPELIKTVWGIGYTMGAS
ncbi:response regulator transcription factor [Aureibacillus halotolerans]|uniref:DNA-binding response OmpR family regulator n=1 Tax=Aureibacillus halotolerans TaxID=1508390 RepID=A0A4R6TU69_9BACI|nr:response regulator transcription factor [Aureibacillus halotolerans]TDQ34628.1 DNA-binding response OmpR family regulator [Aureibacillus halotolerans]